MPIEKVVRGTYEGVLFIGDPHVTSRRPGRRVDDFLSSVLGKLSESAKLCRELNLLPIITGDLIHRENESSTELIHRLMRVLKEFPVAPLDVEGNHGKVKAKLDIGDIEAIMHDAGVLNVVSEPGLFADILVQGRRVQLFACPHGFPLPTDLAVLGARPDAARVLVTHHDLAFENDYPGALPLPEVQNCEAAVNGHMHKTSPSVTVGATVWHCPGNIEPLSIDVRDHRPAVWVMRADSSSLVPHYLQHNADCFNMAGLLVPAMDGAAAAAALRNEDALPDVPEFLAELQAQDEADLERTDDASAFVDDVEAVLQESGASEATQLLMRTLVERVRARAA